MEPSGWQGQSPSPEPERTIIDVSDKIHGVRTAERRTYRVRHIDVRWRNLLALFTGFLDLFHVPDAQSRTTQLSPHFRPAIIFVRLLAVRLALESPHKRSGEIDFVRMCNRELHHGPNFWVERWWSRCSRRAFLRDGTRWGGVRLGVRGQLPCILCTTLVWLSLRSLSLLLLRRNRRKWLLLIERLLGRKQVRLLLRLRSKSIILSRRGRRLHSCCRYRWK